SSSVDVSSSSSSVEVVSSSSVEANVSSSSVEPMGLSSSEEASSSSVVLSSSSLLQSSSSLASSSSSAVPSSSSVVQSSSSVLASVCSSYNASTHFCDKRDGKVYKWVNIGNQDWMAQNLNYDVPENTTDVCYNNSSNNCVTYGRLYNWATALAACPSGWHLPSDAEWNVLMTAVGGSSTAGTKLKATSGWSTTVSGYIAGTDNYGFSALPGGYGVSGGSFSAVGSNGVWWSSTEDGTSNAWYRGMGCIASDVGRYSYGKSYLFSVLCLRDE
ncbi:MAG: fibrobacter succinogenes major paralogous domain-containing protein, partial [Fibromonadales bacterium]|nr:fibrobacter succinogenes major paralogous domain-containing protein [Fibromonadales bacterium]